MKKWISITAFLIVSTLLFSLLPFSAWASATHTLWVAPVSGELADELPINAVKWVNKSGTYYLLLPTEAAGKRLQLWFEGANTATVDNGGYIYNKQSIAPLSQGAHTFTLGNASYSVTVMYSQNIGAMYINTDTGSLSFVHESKDNKDEGDMRMVSADGSKVYYEGRLTQMKGRGNATWTKEKKPYQIKTESKVELVEGAGKHKTWLLLANYLDQSMVRNSFIYDLANDVYAAANSPMMQFVDLYCNNEYQGTYSVCEKVEIGENRVEINDLEGATEDANPDTDLDSFERFGPNTAELGSSKGYKIANDPDDITGGYLLEVESHPRYENEVSGFVTTRGEAIVIKEPEYASEAQVAYISNYFQEFEDALYAPDGVNPTTGKRYDEYFDLSSLVRKYIIEELSMNIDANLTSQFFYKPADGEAAIAYCAPVWDYDNSFANNNGTASLTAWYATGKGSTVNCRYYQQMKTHISFNNALIAEWQANFLPIIEEAMGTEDNPNTYTRPLSYYTELLGPSAELNNICWNWNILKPLNFYELDTGGPTYEGTVNFLKSFIRTRSDWFNSQWSLDAIVPAAETADGQQTVVSMSNYDPSATYYTVSNEAEMRAFSDLVNNGTSFMGKTVLQTADITLTPLSAGQTDTHNRIGKVPNGTNPVSSSTAPNTFRGTYNGGGYKIYNVVVDRENRSGVGLFGAAYGATFIDVHVASGSLTGGTRVGGICGMADACTFIRCSNAATVNCTGYTGDSFSFNGTDAAGIAGIAREDSAFISCYNTGDITGVTGLAGICGFSNYGTLTVSNCYNTGVFFFSGTLEGSPIARQAGNGTSYSDCYALEGVMPAGVTDKHTTPTVTAQELTDGTLLSNLNSVNNIWQSGPEGPVHKAPAAEEFPRVTVTKKIGETLISEETALYSKGAAFDLELNNAYYVESVTVNGTPATEKTVAVNGDLAIVYQLKEVGKPISQLNGAGSYYIADAAGLSALLEATATNELKDYTFYIVNDIDASSVERSGNTFAGTLNGKGSAISGLCVPLFQAVADDGKVTKLTLKNAAVSGGGAIADTNNGIISYINTENLVISGADQAGGIAATNNGYIFACSTGGNTIGNRSAGGIAATNNGNIRNCLNAARIVSVGGTVGGIAAANNGSAASCISRGILNAAARYAVAPGKQTECFAWSDVRGSNNGDTAVTDLTLRSADFANSMNPIFWTTGKESPVPLLTAGELGDISGDDRVDTIDATTMLRYLVGLLSEDQVNLENGNLCDTPDIAPNDVTCLLRHLLWQY